MSLIKFVDGKHKLNQCTYPRSRWSSPAIKEMDRSTITIDFSYTHQSLISYFEELVGGTRNDFTRCSLGPSGLVAMAAAYPADTLEMIEEELRRGKSEGMDVDLNELDDFLEEILKETTAPPPPPKNQLKTVVLQALTEQEMGANNDAVDPGTKLAMLQELFKEMQGEVNYF